MPRLEPVSEPNSLVRQEKMEQQAQAESVSRAQAKALASRPSFSEALRTLNERIENDVILNARQAELAVVRAIRGTIVAPLEAAERQNEIVQQESRQTLDLKNRKKKVTVRRGEHSIHVISAVASKEDRVNDLDPSSDDVQSGLQLTKDAVKNIAETILKELGADRLPAVLEHGDRGVRDVVEKGTNQVLEGEGVKILSDEISKEVSESVRVASVERLSSIGAEAQRSAYEDPEYVAFKQRAVAAMREYAHRGVEGCAEALAYLIASEGDMALRLISDPSRQLELQQLSQKVVDESLAIAQVVQSVLGRPDLVADIRKIGETYVGVDGVPGSAAAQFERYLRDAERGFAEKTALYLAGNQSSVELSTILSTDVGRSTARASLQRIERGIAHVEGQMGEFEERAEPLSQAEYAAQRARVLAGLRAEFPSAFSSPELEARVMASLERASVERAASRAANGLVPSYSEIKAAVINNAEDSERILTSMGFRHPRDRELVLRAVIGSEDTAATALRSRLEVLELQRATSGMLPWYNHSKLGENLSLSTFDASIKRCEEWLASSDANAKLAPELRERVRENLSSIAVQTLALNLSREADEASRWPQHSREGIARDILTLTQAELAAKYPAIASNPQLRQEISSIREKFASVSGPLAVAPGDTRLEAIDIYRRTDAATKGVERVLEMSEKYGWDKAQTEKSMREVAERTNVEVRATVEARRVLATEAREVVQSELARSLTEPAVNFSPLSEQWIRDKAASSGLSTAAVAALGREIVLEEASRPPAAMLALGGAAGTRVAEYEASIVHALIGAKGYSIEEITQAIERQRGKISTELVELRLNPARLESIADGIAHATTVRLSGGDPGSGAATAEFSIAVLQSIGRAVKSSMPDASGKDLGLAAERVVRTLGGNLNPLFVHAAPVQFGVMSEEFIEQGRIAVENLTGASAREAIAGRVLNVLEAIKRRDIEPSVMNRVTEELVHVGSALAGSRDDQVRSIPFSLSVPGLTRALEEIRPLISKDRELLVQFKQLERLTEEVKALSGLASTCSLDGSLLTHAASVRTSIQKNLETLGIVAQTDLVLAGARAEAADVRLQHWRQNAHLLATNYEGDALLPSRSKSPEGAQWAWKGEAALASREIQFALRSQGLNGEDLATKSAEVWGEILKKNEGRRAEVEKELRADAERLEKVAGVGNEVVLRFSQDGKLYAQMGVKNQADLATSLENFIARWDPSWKVASNTGVVGGIFKNITSDPKEEASLSHAYEIMRNQPYFMGRNLRLDATGKNFVLDADPGRGLPEQVIGVKDLIERQTMFANMHAARERLGMGQREVPFFDQAVAYCIGAVDQKAQEHSLVAAQARFAAAWSEKAASEKDWRDGGGYIGAAVYTWGTIGNGIVRGISAGYIDVLAENAKKDPYARKMYEAMDRSMAAEWGAGWDITKKGSELTGAVIGIGKLMVPVKALTGASKVGQIASAMMVQGAYSASHADIEGGWKERLTAGGIGMAAPVVGSAVGRLTSTVLGGTGRALGFAVGGIDDVARAAGSSVDDIALQAQRLAPTLGQKVASGAGQFAKQSIDNAAIQYVTVSMAGGELTWKDLVANAIVTSGVMYQRASTRDFNARVEQLRGELMRDTPANVKAKVQLGVKELQQRRAELDNQLVTTKPGRDTAKALHREIRSVDARLKLEQRALVKAEAMVKTFDKPAAYVRENLVMKPARFVNDTVVQPVVGTASAVARVGFYPVRKVVEFAGAIANGGNLLVDRSLAIGGKVAVAPVKVCAGVLKYTFRDSWLAIKARERVARVEGRDEGFKETAKSARKLSREQAREKIPEAMKAVESAKADLAHRRTWGGAWGIDRAAILGRAEGALRALQREVNRPIRGRDVSEALASGWNKFTTGCSSIAAEFRAGFAESRLGVGLDSLRNRVTAMWSKTTGAFGAVVRSGDSIGAGIASIVPRVGDWLSSTSVVRGMQTLTQRIARFSAMVEGAVSKPIADYFKGMQDARQRAELSDRALGRLDERLAKMTEADRARTKARMEEGIDQNGGRENNLRDQIRQKQIERIEAENQYRNGVAKSDRFWRGVTRWVTDNGPIVMTPGTFKGMAPLPGATVTVAPPPPTTERTSPERQRVAREAEPARAPTQDEIVQVRQALEAITKSQGTGGSTGSPRTSPPATVSIAPLRSQGPGGAAIAKAPSVSQTDRGVPEASRVNALSRPENPMRTSPEMSMWQKGRVWARNAALWAATLIPAAGAGAQRASTSAPGLNQPAAVSVESARSQGPGGLSGGKLQQSSSATKGNATAATIGRQAGQNGSSGVVQQPRGEYQSVVVARGSSIGGSAVEARMAKSERMGIAAESSVKRADTKGAVKVDSTEIAESAKTGIGGARVTKEVQEDSGTKVSIETESKASQADHQMVNQLNAAYQQVVVSQYAQVVAERQATERARNQSNQGSTRRYREEESGGYFGDPKREEKAAVEEEVKKRRTRWDEVRMRKEKADLFTYRRVSSKRRPEDDVLEVEEIPDAFKRKSGETIQKVDLPD